MAINYDGVPPNPPGLFYRIGKVVKVVELLDYLGLKKTGSPFSYDIPDAYQRASSLLDGVSVPEDREAIIRLSRMASSHCADYEALKASVVQTVGGILASHLVEEEKLQSDNLQFLLDRLSYFMKRDSKTIKRNTSSSTPELGNSVFAVSVGDSSALGLDSVAQSSRVAPTNRVKAVCVRADGPFSQWAISGNIPRGRPYSPYWHHLGDIGYIPTTSGYNNNLIVNGGFESFPSSSSPPVGWTISSGQMETTVHRSTDSYLGSYAVRTNGTAVLKTKDVIPFEPNSKYLLSLRYKLVHNNDATLGFGLDDTNDCYDTFELYPSSSYSLLAFAFNTGPSPFYDRVKILRESSGAEFFFDEVTLCRMYERSGIWMAMLYDKEAPLEPGYTLNAEVTNDFEGKFDTFFIRFFGVVLPGSDSPNIPDSLVS